MVFLVLNKKIIKFSISFLEKSHEPEEFLPWSVTQQQIYTKKKKKFFVAFCNCFLIN